MANQKQLVKDLLSTLAVNISDEGLNKRKELTNFVISNEDMDSASRESATVVLEKLQDTVSRTLTAVLSQEDIDATQFTEAQYNAANQIAALALDPKAAIEAYRNPKTLDVKGPHSVITGDVLGVEDMVMGDQLSSEGYDGEATNNAIYFSIVSNFMSATQDKFGEAFFPTINMDPTVSGATIECEFTSIYKEIARKTDGSSSMKDFDKTPIVKAIFDNKLFGNDKNRLIPVVRPNNKAVLLDDVYSFVEYNGVEDITTAPLAFGKTIGLLGISQTDAQLAKGVMDNTDALDRTLNVTNVYYSLTGENSAGKTVTENFAVNIAILPHSNFTYSPQAHAKSLGLTFSSDAIAILTSSTTTVTGAASAILSQLPAGHTVQMHMVLHGDADTQSGDIAVYASEMKIAAILDSAGNVIPSTSADYATIAKVIDTVKLLGYYVEAYSTNSNLRKRGQLVTTDRYIQIYNVPLRTGVTVLAPVNSMSGTDNDAARLTSQITYAGIRTSVDAVKTLVNHADMLNNITNNGVPVTADLMGVGRFYVDTYYNEVNIAVDTHVDSIKSKDRLADIRSLLVNKIKNETVNMAIKANYFIANVVLNGANNGKMQVIIGTDPIIGSYLTENGEGVIDLGPDYEGIVVTTPNKLIRGSIFVSFGIFDANRNVKANPLNFGQCFRSPSITTDVVRTLSGSTSRELTSMNRYLHVINLPLMFRLNVTGIATALEKVAIDFRTVK